MVFYFYECSILQSNTAVSGQSPSSWIQYMYTQTVRHRYILFV